MQVEEVFLGKIGHGLWYEPYWSLRDALQQQQPWLIARHFALVASDGKVHCLHGNVIRAPQNQKQTHER